MKNWMTVTACFAMALSATIACAAEGSGRPVSIVVAAPLKEAQAAMNAAQYPEALIKLHEAQSQADRSAFDDYEIDEALGFVHAKTNEYLEAAFYFEAALRSGFMDPAAIPARVRMLAQLNYMAKNYIRAVDYGKRSLASSDGDETMYTLIAQSLYLTRQSAALLEFLEPHVTQLERQGHPADGASLNLLLAASTELDDKQRITQYLRRLSEIDPRRYADKYAKWVKSQSSSNGEKASARSP